jgi:hypothetical protein
MLDLKLFHLKTGRRQFGRVVSVLVAITGGTLAAGSPLLDQSLATNLGSSKAVSLIAGSHSRLDPTQLRATKPGAVHEHPVTTDRCLTSRACRLGGFEVAEARCAVVTAATNAVAATFPENLIPKTMMLPAESVGPTTTTEVRRTEINTLAKVESDMEQANVVFPEGVPSDYSWYAGPGLEAGNHVPAGYSAITMWGQLYPELGGSPQANVSVEFRDPETWIYSRSRQTWIEVQGTANMQGDYYLATFAGNSSTPAKIVTGPDGGYAVKPPKDGYNFHFWPSDSRGTVNASDVGGVFTTVEARLVATHPSLPADLSPDQYVLDVGGDYWQSPTAPYPDNEPIFQSRFDAVTAGWQSFDAITWSQAKIDAKPALPLNLAP